MHHLKHNIGDPKTTILFAGYQAPHTLGRKILDGHEDIPILGKQYRCRARVERIEGCSAHADRNELLDWATTAAESGHLSRIFLVHGDAKPAAALAEGLGERRLGPVEIPQRGESFEI